LNGTDVCRAVIEELLRIPNPTRRDVESVKLEVCKRLGALKIPSNSELISALRPGEERLLRVLKRKPVRTISGVVVVAAMTKPWPCPHGRCAYCPGGPPYGVPQSYTGHEPASRRGLEHMFDPYEQVSARIQQLRAIGHEVDKVELIVMGGTFPATPLWYQRWFIKGCLEAMIGSSVPSLEEAKKKVEEAPVRNVGITVETRPDWAKERHVDRMLSLGVTRVELGVQTIYDDVYELVERGHTVEDVVEATRILKDSGLKVCYHMMPGLPGSNWERDLEAFRTLFGDERFMPDMLKIYPCLVLKGTKVYEWWLRGEYRPMTTEEAAELIVEVKKTIPPWVRIMRVQRDIPAYLIVAGVRRSDLRSLVEQRMKEQGVRCRCVRCREVGHRMLKDGVEPDPDHIELVERRYEASEGLEVFLSFEDTRNDVLIGLLRLRVPSEKAHRPEVRESPSTLVRELHVYGPMIPVGERGEGWQHRRFGEELLREAERISAEEFDARKILVTSGLGVKPYYRRLGYRDDGPYVSKPLR